MILSCSNICKSFGSDDIIKNASFHIEDHEKAAIVGINGAGKSTLLKIIVGELAPDSGEVVLGSGKTLGYLAQKQDLLSHRTSYEEMRDAKKSVIDVYKRQIPRSGSFISQRAVSTRCSPPMWATNTDLIPTAWCSMSCTPSPTASSLMS